MFRPWLCSPFTSESRTAERPQHSFGNKFTSNSLSGFDFEWGRQRGTKMAKLCSVDPGEIGYDENFRILYIERL